jgi:toluene monooxygenase electron transfer component
MRVQLNARNRAFEFGAKPGEKILYAGLGARIALPYECGTGTCGTCKARLVDGAIEDSWPDAPGRKHLKANQDEFLMCQCAATSDVTVEVASFVYAMDSGACPVTAIGGEIVATRQLTHDVMAVDIALERPLEFDAGQFMAVAVPGIPGHRGYSMVSFDRQARRLEFVIKKKPGGGISEWLFAGSRKGSAIQMIGPLGQATFYPSLSKDILCVAGGSGIAGMMSILARARQERYFDRRRGYVFFGVRTLQDAFYLAELAELRMNAPDSLEVTVALSEEDVSPEMKAQHPTLKFERGLVHDVAKRAMQGRFEGVRAYLAGPPPAVDAAIRFLLLEARLTADNIRYDKFS